MISLHKIYKFKHNINKLVSFMMLKVSCLLCINFQAMRRERDRQIAEGKLKGDEQYVNPRVDSF